MSREPVLESFLTISDMFGLFLKAMEKGNGIHFRHFQISLVLFSVKDDGHFTAPMIQPYLRSFALQLRQHRLRQVWYFVWDFHLLNTSCRVRWVSDNQPQWCERLTNTWFMFPAFTTLWGGLHIVVLVYRDVNLHWMLAVDITIKGGKRLAAVAAHDGQPSSPSSRIFRTSETPKAPLELLPPPEIWSSACSALSTLQRGSTGCAGCGRMSCRVDRRS